MGITSSVITIVGRIKHVEVRFCAYTNDCSLYKYNTAVIITITIIIVE